MWMRACAICKAVLFKVHLVDKVRCQCGWEWGGLRPKKWGTVQRLQTSSCTLSCPA